MTLAQYKLVRQHIDTDIKPIKIYKYLIIAFLSICNGCCVLNLSQLTESLLAGDIVTWVVGTLNQGNRLEGTM
jgi:hypothetical protein